MWGSGLGGGEEMGRWSKGDLYEQQNITLNTLNIRDLYLSSTPQN